MTTETTNKRRISGVVVSDKMDKTIVVRVDRKVLHELYAKQFTKSKKYKVHDEKNEAKEGNEVLFEETRPMSKDKCWKLVAIVKK